MMLSMRVFAGFALAASTAVLGAALAAQYWGGLVPCELCLLERWPWRVAITISLVALLVGSRPALPWVALLLAIVFLSGAAIAFYHVGVEQHWFAGPSACTARAAAGSIATMTLAEMKRQILATPPVLCDTVQWSLFGVSLAGWNFLASLGMAAISAAAFVRSRGAASGEPAPA
jgi:disulfide bond formation protein DsbB